MSDYLLTDSLAAIAARMNTKDEAKQREAVIELRSFIDCLPYGFVLADEALSLQALALSIAKTLARRLEGDEEGLALVLAMMSVMKSAAVYAECMNGTQIEEYAFFDVGGSGMVH